MRALVCSCKECFKSWLQWKWIVNILQPHPSVHRAVFFLRSIDSYNLHRPVILESYIGKVIQIKSTELRWRKNLLHYRLGSLKFLPCFLSGLDTVDAECLSSWMPELVAFFQQGNIRFRAFHPWQEHSGVTVLDMSGSILSSIFWVIW